MEIKVLERDENSIRLILTDSSPAFANALRRIMISEVPSMVIDDVFFYENQSALDDETIAHRLGLIPLKTDLDSYVLPEECECKSEMGCNRCRAMLTLEAEATTSAKTVYSGELKSEDPDIVPVSPRIPVIKLAPGQKIKFEAISRLGTGKQHAKWQPVSACGYKYLPVIEINQRLCDACKECIEACPKKVLDLKDDKVAVVNLLACTLCMECVKRCHTQPQAIAVKGDNTSFVFYIETTGTLPVERVVSQAVKILIGEVEEFVKAVKAAGGGSN